MPRQKKNSCARRDPASYRKGKIRTLKCFGDFGYSDNRENFGRTSQKLRIVFKADRRQ
jgi:hypothetical protein